MLSSVLNVNIIAILMVSTSISPICTCDNVGQYHIAFCTFFIIMIKCIIMHLFI